VKFTILGPVYTQLPREAPFWTVTFTPIGFVTAASAETALQRAKRMGFVAPVIEPTRKETLQ
jgi:hypothetical protein